MSTSNQQKQAQEEIIIEIDYKVQAEEYKDHLQRLQAEFENYQKFMQKQLQDIKTEAKKEIIVKILDIIDNLERALEHKENNQALKEGLELTHKQALQILEKEGVEQKNDKGKSYNIYEHEVLKKQTADQPENTILEVIQKGYTINKKELRVAKVIVAQETEH